MNGCEKYHNMISAYADGEASEAETAAVEDHISKCAGCAALLHFYRSITVAVNSESAAAPDALRKGVMDKIASDTAYSVNAGKTRRDEAAAVSGKPFRIVLTRIMPIAACLAVALLAWGVFGDFAEYSDSAADVPGSSAGNQNTEADMAVAMDMDGGGFVKDEDDGNDGGLTREANSGTAAADGGSFEGSRNPSAETQANSPSLYNLGFNAILPWDIYYDETDNIYEDKELTEDEIRFAVKYVKGASRWIAITGGFPDVLDGYEPEPVGDVFGWEQVFWILNGEIPSLLKNLSDFSPDTAPDSYFIYLTEENHANSASEYTLVLYDAR